MKTWDVILIGAGIIGLSLAIALRKQGLRVLVIERGEPGREASHAAAGMLVPSGAEMPEALKPMAETSSKLYPEFVHELEDESGIEVAFREQGTILLSHPDAIPDAGSLSANDLRELEPALDAGEILDRYSAFFSPESSVDPRLLIAAAIKAAQHRSVDLSSGSEAVDVLLAHGRVAGVQTRKTFYAAEKVVNCAGAWAGSLGPCRFPVRPVKGQMLAVVHGPALRHVVRSSDVYIVPRADGRLVIGSTLENAGYDKNVDVRTIKHLFDAAVNLSPALAKSQQHEAWAGLRPGTPDCLPVLGETATPGYFVATGHYRDGILLAPVTARLMAAAVCGENPPEMEPFSPSRFDL